MSTQKSVQIVKDVLPAVGRGDKQGLLALSGEQLRRIERSGFRDDVLRGLSGPQRSVLSRWTGTHFSSCRPPSTNVSEVALMGPTQSEFRAVEETR
jgi:hypothetical protein